MRERTDVELLRDYAERGHEAAFRELVTRYTDLVYSVALRQLESPDLAGDITQGVFLDLARKARAVSERLVGHNSLAGWLHRSTRYAVLNHLRDTRRRVANERQAMEQLLNNSEASVDWNQIRPALDEALDSLGDEDREALLLRYFKNQDLRTVGVAFGVSDDAAQKRVNRAVERLREFFAKRGVSIGAGGLVAVVSANAVQAAPAGLALTISTAAALGGTAVVTTATATKAIAMTTLQKTFVTATVAILAGVVLYEARQASQLRAQVQLIRQQQAPLSRQIEELSHQRDEAARQLAVLRNENERLSRNTSELLRLRGEIARLRNAAQMPGQHETKKERENAFTLVRVGPLLLPVDSDDKKQLEELKFENEVAIQNQASNKLASLKTFLNLSAEQEEQIYALLLRQMALEDNSPGGIRSVSFVGLLEMSMFTPMEFNLRTSDMSAERAVENHEAIARADEQFKTLLSPDQQSVYEQYKKDQISTRARQLANGQAKGLTEALGLTSEQQDKVSAALLGIWSAATDPIAGSDFRQWFREKNLKALEGILSLEQLMQVRRLASEPAN